jgi:hypothetical protein
MKRLLVLLMALSGTLSVAAAVPAHGQVVSVAAATSRAFTCSGSAGEAFTEYTVAGDLNAGGMPLNVEVTRVSTGVVESRARRATLLGSSVLHAGYVAWDITGRNPDGNTYTLHAPAILPASGGFFDADLDVEFAGGSLGGLQISMFDCTVTGGPPWIAPAATSFTCTGGLGEAFTYRTVAGRLELGNLPRGVRVTQTGTGLVVSKRRDEPASLGPSWLHAGYAEWDITGRNPDGDVYILHAPPVLPPAGGYFDADLEILFAGGDEGEWQISMFDCAAT